MTGSWMAFAALIAMTLVSPAPSLATPTAKARVACRERCAATIADCVASAMSARPARAEKRVARRCRRQALRSCLRGKPDACPLATTTSTTLPNACPGYKPLLLGRVWQGPSASCEFACYMSSPIPVIQRPCELYENSYASGIRFAVRDETCGRFSTSEPWDGMGQLDTGQVTRPVPEPAPFSASPASYGFPKPFLTGVLENGVLLDVEMWIPGTTLGCGITTRFAPLVQVPAEP